MNNNKMTALYERLSRDDEQFGDSVSIVNQKEMLEAYAKQNGYTDICHYTDDGYSGGSFDRPGWKRMMEDIESGKISTVIAKDMSRIGRNYLEVGYFTEVVFRQRNIHFIAIANGVDSDNQSSSEFAPFLNIMNEWYLRDCSKKIKATKQSIGNSGKHLSVFPVFGYKLDPDDKHKWIVDEDAAEVVKYIYRLCVEGNGTQDISRRLQKEKVETPSYYMAKQGLGQYKNMIEVLRPYDWNSSTVKTILTRPEYLGYTVNFRTSSKSYKEHKNIINPPEKWAVFENTQEPIVDLETWQLVQRLVETPRRSDTIGVANPLTGLVFCADCGAKMYNHRARAYVDKNGKKYSGYDNYDCSVFKLSSRHDGEAKCCSHHINSNSLRELILFTIKNVSRYAISNKNDFISCVREASKVQQDSTAKELKRKLNKDKKRYNELNGLYKKLYESYALEKISEEKFKMLSVDYEREQKELQTVITEAENNIKQFETDNINIEGFMELTKKYTDFTELTTPMINEFIEKIIVHAPDKSSGTRTQEVEIYLNFIGNIEVPQPEPTPEEIEQAKIDKYWKDRYQRTKEKELARRKKQTAKITAIREKEEAEQKQKEIENHRKEIAKIGAENLPVIPAKISNRAERG